MSLKEAKSRMDNKQKRHNFKIISRFVRVLEFARKILISLLRFLFQQSWILLRL